VGATIASKDTTSHPVPEFTKPKTLRQNDIAQMTWLSDQLEMVRCQGKVGQPCTKDGAQEVEGSHFLNFVLCSVLVGTVVTKLPERTNWRRKDLFGLMVSVGSVRGCLACT
jgi:hypothetical protein